MPASISEAAPRHRCGHASERRRAGLAPDASPTAIAAWIKADLRGRYARGERPAVADYLEWFPQVCDEVDRVVSLAYEEYCLREERGERIDPELFCARYAMWSDSLASQLRYHQLLSQATPSAPAAVGYPVPGERFGAFVLDAVLGQGGTSRVYLARDEELGGRVVVLKISTDRGLEPSVLGRLDHGNIMPALSVTRQAATGLRGLCMPYRPGLPLDEVIRRVDAIGRLCGARALRLAAASGGETPGGLGWEGFPERGCFADAAAWAALGLARALEHVHSRGVLHGDVKPANVLLALRDGPQLLDFGLARAPGSAGGAEIKLYGGTLSYMAPEQLEAFIRLSPCAWRAVGAPADLYGLGLLFEELLTGRPPFRPDPAFPLPRAIRELLHDRAAPRASRVEAGPRPPEALEAIVARCVAFLPSDRYPDARTLVEDLREYLDLRLAPCSPSRRDRRQLEFPAVSPQPTMPPLDRQAERGPRPASMT